MSYKNTDSRAVNLAHYILEKQTTIRATGKYFNLPKSTVHHDLCYKLKKINHALYKKVQKLMKKNFSIKHMHGGESTKLKYLALKKFNDEEKYVN